MRNIVADPCAGANGSVLRIAPGAATPRAVAFDGAVGGGSCVQDVVCSGTGDIRLPAGATWSGECPRKRLGVYAVGAGPRLITGRPDLPTEQITLPAPRSLKVKVWIVRDAALDDARLEQVKDAVVEQLGAAEAAYLDLGAGVSLEYDPSPVVITDPTLRALIGVGCDSQWAVARRGADLGVYDRTGINIYVVRKIGTGEPDGKNCRDYEDASIGRPHPEIMYLAYDGYVEDSAVGNWWSTAVIAHEMGHGVGPMEGWWDHVDGIPGFDGAHNLMNGAGPPVVKEITLGQSFRIRFVGSALIPTLDARTDMLPACGDGTPGTGNPGTWCPVATLKPAKPWP